MSIDSNVQETVEEKVVVSVQPPKLWKVVFLNDNSTPMEFVTEVLANIFKHNEEKAREITLEIHNTGSAVVGIYSYEVAEQKGLETTQLARSNGFPLKVNIEEE